MDKKKLYKQIMESVSKSVKNHLNEYNVRDFEDTTEEDEEYFNLVKQYYEVDKKITDIQLNLSPLLDESNKLLRKIEDMQKIALHNHRQSNWKDEVMQFYNFIIESNPSFSKFPCYYQKDNSYLIFVAPTYRKAAIRRNKLYSIIFEYVKKYQYHHRNGSVSLTLKDYISNYPICMVTVLCEDNFNNTLNANKDNFIKIK